MLAKISFIYPNEPININPGITTADAGSLFSGTGRLAMGPGHSPGQVALFRESDKTLISADAIILL